MRLLESGEMYIETIYVLSKKSGSVRNIDICEHMGYSKPSVSRAIGLLKQGGFVQSDEQGRIALTEKGCEVAEKMYERHTLLTEFLVKIGVDRAIASDDACKIEHDISDISFEAIKALAEKLKESE